MIVSIVGAGGHGRDLAEIAAALGHRVVAFYDDDASLGFPPCVGQPVTSTSPSCLTTARSSRVSPLTHFH